MSVQPPRTRTCTLTLYSTASHRLLWKRCAGLWHGGEREAGEKDAYLQGIISEMRAGEKCDGQVDGAGADAIIVDMSNTKQVVLPQIAQERFKRLESRTAKIGVIGLGYVGLPLSLLLSEAGFKVTGFDIDTKKVAELEAGRSYIFRIAAEEIQGARKKGFTATTEFSQLSEQDAMIMCVPTPLTEHREPDLSYVENTAKAAAPWVREGQLVVLESTTYPGTTEELMIPVLEAGNHRG